MNDPTEVLKLLLDPKYRNRGTVFTTQLGPNSRPWEIDPYE